LTPEAPLRQTKFGLAPDGEGWFVVNAREIRWRAWERLGVYCDFEGKKRFKQLGFNISVLQPGESLGRYHRENAQEDFLVVSGRCVVIVEDEERELRAWDFFHSPPGTAHMVVGAGDGPSVVVAVGARGRRPKGLVYPVSAVAAKHGVSVVQETHEASEAYSDLARPVRVSYEEGWLPDRLSQESLVRGTLRTEELSVADIDRGDSTDVRRPAARLGEGGSVSTRKEEPS